MDAPLSSLPSLPLMWPPRRRDLLGTILSEIGLEPDASVWLREPGLALERLERAAERAPADRRLADALAVLIDRLALEASSPAVVGGVRRERLVRWDAASAVWVGRAEPGGGERMVRVLRQHAAADPAWRRFLLREARALEDHVAVEVIEGEPREGPALGLALGGRPLSGASRRLARPLATGLDALGAWERAGLGLPELAECELRLDDEDRVVVACLWPVAGGVREAVASLAARLLHGAPERPGSALATCARGLALHPGTAEEAARAVRAAMAEELAGRRHALVAAWRDRQQQGRSARLLDVLARLHRAARAPAGRGEVGVGPDGRPRVVVSDGEGVRWGVDGEALEVVCDPSGALRPQEARGLLRARATRPPVVLLGERLDTTDAICRWLTAGLRLRTLRLLLEREAA